MFVVPSREIGTGTILILYCSCACAAVPGHNCFGAVLYPITMADFTIADVTDAMLDGPQHSLSTSVMFYLSFAWLFEGYIAGFPNTYAQKVGKTSDSLYKGSPLRF